MRFSFREEFRKRGWITPAFYLLFLVVVLSVPSRGDTSAGLQLTIDRALPSAAVSYLLWDLNSNKILAKRWEHSDEPIVVGSLIKPFTAAAYILSTEKSFPQFVCQGAQSFCWLPQGHGRLGIERAIEDSCNTYFLSLAQEIPYERAVETFAQLGLPSFERGGMDRTLAGLSRSWKVQPVQLATAYAQLLRESRRDTRMSEILLGMKLSAARGTAKAIRTKVPEAAVLAKTGTAACSHPLRATADGFTVAMFPAEQPRLLVLVRVHGVTGAVSAAAAGAILALVEHGRS